MGAGFIVSLLSGTSEQVMQWLPPAAAVRERYGLGNSRDRSLTRPPGPTARLVQSIPNRGIRDRHYGVTLIAEVDVAPGNVTVSRPPPESTIWVVQDTHTAAARPADTKRP